MISLPIVLYLLFAHYVADFLCQTDYMAQNKSQSNTILMTHVGIYSLVITVGMWLIGIGLLNGFIFYVSCFVFHFITDYITSRQTKRLFGKKDYHWGFAVVGIDQFAHYCQLLITYYLLTN